MHQKKPNKLDLGWNGVAVAACRSLAQSQEPVATWLDSARASEDHALEIVKSNPTYCKLQFVGPPVMFDGLDSPHEN